MKYRDVVLRSVSKSKTRTLAFNGYNGDIVNGAMGLAGESGEVCDLVKKFVFQNKPYDENRLIEELGDVRWYLELMCYGLGISVEQLEKLNEEKLRKRYPEAFEE